MLEFYKNSSDHFTDRVEQKLEELVVSHKIMNVNDPNSLPEQVTTDDLPVLSDTHQIWQNPKEIEAYLDELEQEVKLGRSMQSDSCHIDPENPEECL